MNMLEAVCPNGHRLQVPLEHAGMKLRCPAPGCGVIFQLSAASPNGGTIAVGAGAAAAGTPQAPAAPQPPAPPQPPASAPQQPQSSQTYANVPLSSAPTGTPGDGGRWSGTEPAAAPSAPSTSQSGPLINAPLLTPTRGRALDLSGGALLGAAQAILMLGLVLVLTARGCDSLGARNVVRLNARLSQEQQAFKAKLQEEINAEPDAAKQAKLRESHDKQRSAQEKTWASMQNAVSDAASANLIWGYWREMTFVVGTILLSLGLTAVAFVGQGVERYLSFGLLAIIVFSVYIGGAAWFTSIVGGLQGLVPGR